jgi:hypothetical protein
LSLTTAIGAGTVRSSSGGLVEQVELAAIGAQILQPEQPFGALHRVSEAGEGVLAAGGRGDGGGEAVLGGVVDDCADPPDPASAGFELAEVDLPDPVPLRGRVVEHAAADRRSGLAIGPKSPR